MLQCRCTPTTARTQHAAKMIGKRKRDTSVVSRSKATDEEEDSTPTTPTTPTDTSHDLFRKFFESQFEPLEVPGDKVSRDESDKDEEDDEDGEEDDEESEAGSDWEGLPGDDGVEVVEHRESSMKDGLLDKKARKAFMVCGNLVMFCVEDDWTDDCRTRDHRYWNWTQRR